MFDFEEEDLMSKMLELGLVEIHGMDPITNEITYILTEKCKELFPELFEEHMSHVNQIAFDLWKKGYIEMTFDADGVPLVMLRKDIDYYNNAFKEMNLDEITFIQNMLNHYKSR